MTSFTEHNVFKEHQCCSKGTLFFVNQWSCSVVSDFLDPMEYSLPGSFIHGIFQARVLVWVAISFSRGSSQPGDWTPVFHIAATRLTLWATRETNQIHCKVSYLTKAVLAFKSRMSLLCSSGRLDVATTQVSQGEMTAFGRHTPIPDSQKISPCSFKAV